MHSNNRVPQYQIHGLSLLGFRHNSDFINYLFADGKLKTGILTAINAEKIINAERNLELKRLLNEAEYKYPDGISIVRSIHRKYRYASVRRIAGIDLWENLMIRAGSEKIPVFLVGGRPIVLIKTEVKLRTHWNVNVVGRQDGYFDVAVQSVIAARIRDSKAAIVTVAMGSPRQEQFIASIRQEHPQALYMGVGGTYDVFTGYVKRAPTWWQNLGIEWLYRLLKDPSRLQRQLKLLRYLGYHIRG